MVDNIPINLLNINNNSEECMICRDELSSMPCYTLPECKHTYHTSCLVSWFRNGDNRCPYCGNRGINNSCDNNTSLHIPRIKHGYFCKIGFENQYINDLKKFMNNKKNINHPSAIKLKNNFEKIIKLEDDLKENRLNHKKYKINIKTEPVLYSVSRKTLREFRNTNYKIDKQIHQERYKLITNSYIIPLIIPSPVNIH
mgnify:FL=1